MPHNLPFSPQSVDITKQPDLVLGENGVAFAKGSTTVPINGVQTTVDQIASFNIGSGGANWTYQAQPNSTLSILAILSSGSLAINDSQNGIIQLSTTGSPTQTASSFGGVPQYSWGGNWYVQGSQAASAVLLPLEVDPADIWATPNGNPSKNAAEGPLCPCLLQTTVSAPNVPGEGIQSADKSQDTADTETPSAPPAVSCPICNLPPPTALGLGEAPSCTTVAGSGPTYVILVGDSGYIRWNVGYAFDLEAQTQVNSLQSAGNKVVACRVSSIENVVTALTSNGPIAGGVIYFGHSGPFTDPLANNQIVSILAVGQAGGNYDYNVSGYNVSKMAAVVTAANGQNIIGSNASIVLNGCDAGLNLYDHYVFQYSCIAQLVSTSTQRGVYAYKVGEYASLNPASSATSKDYTGEPNPIPFTVPLYMIPLGTPGNKPAPLPFVPSGSCPNPK